MELTQYDFTLTGRTPILFHADDVMEADKLIAWRKDPKNKNLSVPGDDRSPAWTWQTYLYWDENKHLAIPAECLMASIRKAAAGIKLKGQTTFKALSQSGMYVPTNFLEFHADGQQIHKDQFDAIESFPFAQQAERVREMGMSLFVKRAAVDKKKHVRVRLRVDEWQCSGSIIVTEEAITEPILRDFFTYAGTLCGMLDWRPNSPKSPGPYGTFDVELNPASRKPKRKAG